jgi:cobalamin biosynthesis Mg chelatase CobN
VVEKEQGRIVETPTEARQAEPGPSILMLLIVSVALAVLLLGIVWFIFFRT